MKNTIIVLVGLVVVGGGIYWFMENGSKKDVPVAVSETKPTQPADATASTTAPVADASATVIGTSVSGNDITAYHFGTGEKEILFIGGIHGGYEWNTSLVAYQLMDYLKSNPSIIPAHVKVTIIPVMNPDGLQKVVGTTAKFTQAEVSTSNTVVISGRYNANGVDLNRNFDCDWQPTGVWQATKVSGGSAAFSEPESQAVKNYVEKNHPTAAVVWYSAGGGVYASSCHNGISSETTALMQKYASASGYAAHKTFDSYATTGDMVNWLAKVNIPAISVLLTNHSDTEWSKNKAGVDALLNLYAQ